VTATPRLLAILLLALPACRARQAGTVAPAPSTPEQTVEQFFAAVAGNDIQRMGELWGDHRGPSVTYMRDEERTRRLVIMQRALTADEHRIVGSEVTPAASTGRLLTVELVRGSNRAIVPFTLIELRTGGWLIKEIGLEAAFPRTSPRSP
jgi:hypothetical protein